MTYISRALIAMAVFGIGWYMVETAPGYADTACWLTSLTPWPSCS